MITKEDFLRDVSDHVMTVLQDHGVYRHIRFSRPNSGIYRFELTTFPDYLVISGDCGCYVFCRLPDMFDFFRVSELKINEGYWAEKLEAKDRRNGLREFSSKKVKAALEQNFNEWLSEQFLASGDEDAARLEFEHDVLNACEDENDFNSLGVVELGCGYECEAFRFSAHEFCDNFIWCLYAIAWGIQQYDKREAQ